MGKASLVSLLLAAGITALMACSQAARPAAAPADPAQGGGGKPPSDPAPTPQPAAPAEKRWTIGAADFGNDELNLTGAVSNRSAPYAWERITAGGVRVSIGGQDLPFTSTSAKPVFASDISGAEWTVAAEVRAGAVVLLLTAPDQSGAGDTVASVTITNPGSGYTTDPTVTFSAPPAGGATATGTAVRSGSVDSVAITTAGSGYPSVPTVTFSAPPSGATATGAAVGSRHVDSVTITTAGSGYTAVPTVTFGAAPSGGTTATGAAVGSRYVDSVTVATAGSGYTAAPAVTFSGGGGGSGAAATAVRQSGVASVTLTHRGLSYSSDPTVTFGAAPSGGTTATGTATRRSEVSFVTMSNGEAVTRLSQP